MYVIEEITSKDATTRYGVKPSYRVKASGEWYNFGFKKPMVAVGDNVNFNFTEGKYGKDVDAATVKVISSGGGTAGSVTPSAPAARPFGPPARPFPIPALHGDRAIVRQNALTNAREVFTSGYGWNGEKLDSGNPVVVAKHIIAMARMFEEYTTGDSDLAEAMKAE